MPLDAPAAHPTTTDRDQAPHGASARGLTVRDVARRYRVGEDKVRAWIRRGELAALNTSTTLCARPRFVVMPEALVEFERRRTAAPPPKPQRRRRQSGMVDYYPDEPGVAGGGT